MVDESVIKLIATQAGVRFVAGFVDADTAALIRFAHAVEHHALAKVVAEKAGREAEWKCS